MRTRRHVLAVFAAALALRVAFVAWAPRELSGDASFYDAYAQGIARGWGYVNLDGSPGIRWMPGWPALLGALYAVFGVSPLVGMLWNALAGAGSAALVASLGTRWLGPLAGSAAGWLTALWPGLVYYCATLFSEPTFVLLLAATLHAFALAVPADRTRRRWLAAGGAGLGLCALVKAEPLALVPALLFFLWRVRRSPADFVAGAATVLLATALVIAPWSLRNTLVFGRFLPTSANGGIVAYLGHNPGALGGNDPVTAKRFARQHPRENAAESVIARNAAGWRAAWGFARAHPGAEWNLARRKLALTYGGDADGATLVRGLGVESTWHLDGRTWRRLAGVANAWWWAVLSLALLGALAPRAWPPGARPLLGGLLATWLLLHVIFLGGARFHVPETLALAVFAGAGVETLGRGLRRRAPPGT